MPFTDGVDTTSRRASYESNIRDVEELDALIYPVQYDTYGDMGGGGNSGGGGWPSNGDIFDQIFGGVFRRRGGGGPGTSKSDYNTASRYLHDLADKTGARSFEADSTQNLAYAFGQVAERVAPAIQFGLLPEIAGAGWPATVR